MHGFAKGSRRWRTLAVTGLALGLLASGMSGAAAGKEKLPEGYAFPVISEEVPEPLGTEHESVEIYKRAALDLSMKWGIKFVYDDRCAPRVRNSEERLIQAGAPLPTELPPPPPTRVFDNVYYLGLNDVASWALVERGGKEIYIFDALNDAEEGEQYIAGGLEQLGFDPANIKAVFIMHGHRDHWGGSKYLQDTYGATVYAGEADWPAILQSSGAPAFGANIPEGPMMLGDTEVNFYETPGHTVGTISALIPTTFRGTPHLAAYWGGTGFPRNDAPLLQTYINSITDFTMAARRAGADVFMSNHSHSDATVPRMESINFKNRIKGAGDMVWGPEYVTDLLDVINLCARAQYTRQHLPNWPSDLNVDYGELNWANWEASQP